MDEKERLKITNENERRVQKWFEDSGFASQKLDVGSTGNREGQRADWQFTKRGTVVLCEVKTIFSGGEFNGKKEEAFARFEDQVRNSLQTDPQFETLPLTLTISIDNLYVPYGNVYQDFEDFLKQCLEHANYKPLKKSNEYRTFSYSFPNMAGRAIIVVTPRAEPLFRVGFIRPGSDYNYDAFWRNIKKAVSQIKDIAKEKHITGYLPVVALVSSSRQVSFNHLPWLDSPAAQTHMGEIASTVNRLNPAERNFGDQREIITNACSRYKLLDWAFQDYGDDLAAILLLDSYQPDAPPPKTTEEFMQTPWEYDWVDYGYILTNPYNQSFRTAFEANITTAHHLLITGMKNTTFEHFNNLLARLNDDYPHLYGK